MDTTQYDLGRCTPVNPFRSKRRREEVNREAKCQGKRPTRGSFRNIVFTFLGGAGVERQIVKLRVVAKTHVNEVR